MKIKIFGLLCIVALFSNVYSMENQKGFDQDDFGRNACLPSDIIRSSGTQFVSDDNSQKEHKEMLEIASILVGISKDPRCLEYCGEEEDSNVRVEENENKGRRDFSLDGPNGHFWKDKNGPKDSRGRNRVKYCRYCAKKSSLEKRAIEHLNRRHSIELEKKFEEFEEKDFDKMDEIPKKCPFDKCTKNFSIKNGNVKNGKVIKEIVKHIDEHFKKNNEVNFKENFHINLKKNFHKRKTRFTGLFHMLIDAGHCSRGKGEVYCNYCAKGCRSNWDVKWHVIDNHNVDLEKKFEEQVFSELKNIPKKCPKCNKEFSVKNDKEIKEIVEHIAKHFEEKNNKLDDVNGGQVNNLSQMVVTSNFVNNINSQPLVGSHFDEIRPLFGLDQGQDRLLPSFTDLNVSVEVEKENEKNDKKRKHDELVGGGNKKLGGQEGGSSCGSEECDEEECSESKEKDSEDKNKRRKME